jgi:two-component system response regulator HydG
MTLPRPTQILIVDDDPGHLITLKTITRSWGYAVATADDGAAAVDMVKSTAMDLILMDVRMAKLSGIEALER